MPNSNLAETRRDGIEPRCRIRCYGEVLATGTLCCRSDVVQRGMSILDHQVGMIDEGRLDLRGRPGRMEIQQYGGRSGNVRRRHRRAAEEGPTSPIAWTRVRLAHAGDRAEDEEAD